jgi:hypothetical protein
MSLFLAKANKDLYDKWDKTAKQIDACKVIVQSERQMDSAQVLDWLHRADELTRRLQDLTNETMKYLAKIAEDQELNKVKR